MDFSRRRPDLRQAIAAAVDQTLVYCVNPSKTRVRFFVFLAQNEEPIEVTFQVSTILWVDKAPNGIRIKNWNDLVLGELTRRLTLKGKLKTIKYERVEWTDSKGFVQFRTWWKKATAAAMALESTGSEALSVLSLAARVDLDRIPF